MELHFADLGTHSVARNRALLPCRKEVEETVSNRGVKIMALFSSTLNQMAFLVLLIAIGYILVKLKVVDGTAAGLLSKLENNVFVPALMLGTFMNNFTVARLSVSGKFFVTGVIVMCIMAPLGTLIARFFSKSAYERKIYTYGFAFANFGFKIRGRCCCSFITQNRRKYESKFYASYC